MIVVILGFVAGISLIAGWLLNQIALVIVALGASVAGLAVMAAVTVLRRRAARTTGVSEAEDEAEDEAQDEAQQAPDAPQEAAQAAGQPVYVVAGRKRFHARECRLIDGLDTEELTVDEARDEAFTPCTVCLGADVATVP